MTPAEFKVAREFLGLPVDWLAGHLDVSVRSVARWESGEHPIPDGVVDDMGDLAEAAQVQVAAAVHGRPDWVVTLSTYRTDADFRAAEPTTTYPASWHRAICARIADQVPGVRIEYAS